MLATRYRAIDGFQLKGHVQAALLILSYMFLKFLLAVRHAGVAANDEEKSAA